MSRPLKILIKKVLSRLRITKNRPKISYSQCGEDLIVDFIFSTLRFKNITYMDIGAHYPLYLSNTAIFHKRGDTGINIEPDPSLFSPFLTTRKNDINLNIGVAAESSTLDFYIMSEATMNTFSHEEAHRLVSEESFTIRKVEKIRVSSIEDILRDHWEGDQFPDFLSLDVEGLDEIILKTIDFEKHRPIVICLETISYSETGNGVKNQDVIQFLQDKGYMLYADTYINSIFVLRDHWIR